MQIMCFFSGSWEIKMLTQTTLRTKVRIIIDSLKDSKLKAFSFALQSLEIREPGASASSLLIFVLRLESFLVLFQKPVSIRGFLSPFLSYGIFRAGVADRYIQ